MILICVYVHNMIPHSLYLPRSQETFLNTPCQNWILKEVIQTFVSIIIIELLQQRMSSSNPCGSTPEKEIPSKKQFSSIYFSFLQIDIDISNFI